MNRANCYRRQSGLAAGRTSRIVQEAVEGHRDYVSLAENSDIDGLFGACNGIRVWEAMVGLETDADPGPSAEGGVDEIRAFFGAEVR